MFVPTVLNSSSTGISTMSGIMLRTCCRSARLLHQDIFLPVSIMGHQATNTLFTNPFLGLDNFNDTRHKVASQFGPLRGMVPPTPIALPLNNRTVN